MNLPAIENTYSAPWYVLGVGAMGSLWAAAMSQHLAGRLAQPVTLLLRDADAMARYPGSLTITHTTDTGPEANQIALPALSIADTPAGAPRITRLLLSCKAQDAHAAISSVTHLLDNQAIILLLQNGICFQQQLSADRPHGSVFCLSTSAGAWLQSPFNAVAAGQGLSWLGNLYAEQTETIQATQQQLLSELPQTTMNIAIDHNMPQRLWEKLAINCAINGLTVVYNCRNGELLTMPGARAHCEALCQEIMLLMRLIPQTPEVPDLWSRVQQVASQTADNISSTLQDVRHQRKTEIEHLNGYLCNLAAQHELPCPLNQQVLSAVLESARLLPTQPHPAR